MPEKSLILLEPCEQDCDDREPSIRFDDKGFGKRLRAILPSGELEDLSADDDRTNYYPNQ